MRRFKQVDVFTAQPFRGNPVAVVIDAEGLDTETMQRIACWTNLSETTFLLESTVADYRLRIFTPREELPFAGHPTLGSAHAALESGFVAKQTRLRQECAAGVFDLSLEDGKIYVLGPKPKMSEIDATRIASALGAPAKGLLRIDVGAAWVVGELADAAQLAALKPDLALIAEESTRYALAGVTLFAPSGDAASAIHARSFAPAHGIPEDPVCGTGNIAVAAYLEHSGQRRKYGDRYRARQGMQVGRDGQVFMRYDTDGIRIGGPCVTCVDGTLAA
jgi:PhzF family phenazine biosynthesis protein